MESKKHFKLVSMWWNFFDLIFTRTQNVASEWSVETDFGRRLGVALPDAQKTSSAVRKIKNPLKMNRMLSL